MVCLSMRACSPVNSGFVSAYVLTALYKSTFVPRSIDQSDQSCSAPCAASRMLASECTYAINAIKFASPSSRAIMSSSAPIVLLNVRCSFGTAMISAISTSAFANANSTRAVSSAGVAGIVRSANRVAVATKTVLKIICLNIN